MIRLCDLTRRLKELYFITPKKLQGDTAPHLRTTYRSRLLKLVSNKRVPVLSTGTALTRILKFSLAKLSEIRA